jgi:hypothetical protein
VNGDGLEFAVSRGSDSIVWRLDLTAKDVEHEGDPLKTEHVISEFAVSLGMWYCSKILIARVTPVCWYFDFQLRRLLLAIYYRPVIFRRLVYLSNFEFDFESLLINIRLHQAQCLPTPD